MFFGTFSWSFVFVSLPFHIRRISTWDSVHRADVPDRRGAHRPGGRRRGDRRH
jgi:hypothetical protein